MTTFLIIPIYGKKKNNYIHILNTRKKITNKAIDMAIQIFPWEDAF